MKLPGRQRGFFLATGRGGGSTVPSDPITPSMAASRTSGPAPLFVHLDASGTSMSAAPTQGGAFHQLSYAFQRRGAAASAFSNGRANRNARTGGPLWGVVLETPGTENIDLTVSDGTNTATATQAITVINPDTYFSGANTVLVSVAGDFTGSGKTGFATQQPASSSATITVQSGKRLLLRRGETYGQILVPLGASDFQVAVYGSGAKPVVASVLIQGSNTTFTWGHTGAFVDIDFVDSIRIGTTTRRVTFLRCNSAGGTASADLKVDIGAILGYDCDPVRASASFLAAVYWPRELCFADCDIQGVINSTSRPNIVMSGYTAKSAFLGLTCNLAREFPIRLFMLHKTLFNGVDLGGNVQQSGKHPLKLQSCGLKAYDDIIGTYGVDTASRQFIVANSRFGPPGTNNDWLVGAGPENVDPGTAQILFDGIFEDNVFARGENTQQDLHVCANSFTTRRNTVQGGGTLNGDMVSPAEYPYNGSDAAQLYMRNNGCGPYWGQLTN